MKKNRKAKRIKRQQARRATRQSDKREYEKLAREVRSRMRGLERGRVDYWAYQLLKKKTGISSSETIPSYESVTKNQVKHMKKFLDQKTSTLSGLREVQKKQLESLERNVSKRLNKKVRITNTSLLFAMFDSEEGQLFKKQIGSTEFVDKFIELTENREGEDVSFDGVMQAFQDYSNREIGYSEIEEYAKKYSKIEME